MLEAVHKDENNRTLPEQLIPVGEMSISPETAQKL